MRALAIANQKGGSAKTTTAVNLAAALAAQGERVLLLDLDPQASATSWMGVRTGGGGEDRGLLDVLTGNGHLSALATVTGVAGVEVIPGSPWLSSIETALAGEVGREVLLRHAVSKLPANRWTFLVVDCPPALGLLSLSALVACREVLIPVETHALALAGLAAMMQTIDRVRERLNPALTLTGILPCRVDARTSLAREITSRLRERFGAVVFSTVIRETVRLAEAPSHQQPITAYAPDSAGAEDYAALAREVRRRGPQ